jgi:Terpene synthase family 2, C-terminal metal binding
MGANTDRVHCPINPRIGDGADEVHRRSMAWIRQTGLVPTERRQDGLAGARFGDLASRAYPDASVDDRVLIAGWLMYVAVLDDQYDERHDLRAMRKTFRGMTDYLRTGKRMRTRPGPLSHVLESLWQETAAPMPATWRLRFGDSMEMFLDGVRAEAAFRQADRRLSLDEYLELRRSTSACGLLFDLIQLSTHRPLADAVHYHPAVSAVRMTAIDVVAWINDLASMAKEETAGSDHNLVLVVRRTGGLSAPLACAVAIDMVNDGIRRLWSDAAALPDFGGALTDYVNGLKTWVRANIDWSAGSGRYTVPSPSPQVLANDEI